MVYKTPKEVQERKEANRKHILETAAKVFAAQGYHGTTVKDIVDQAGMSVGSFYFYFQSKEHLFDVLYDDITEMLLNAIEIDLRMDETGPLEKVTYSTLSTLLFFQRRRELAKIMLIEAVGLNPRIEYKRAESVRKLMVSIEQSIEAFQENGLINVPSVKVAAIALEGTIYNSIIGWLYEQSPTNLTDLAYPLVIYNLRALEANFKESAVEEYIEQLLTQSNVS